jgi:hypothetical protein
MLSLVLGLDVAFLALNADAVLVLDSVAAFLALDPLLSPISRVAFVTTMSNRTSLLRMVLLLLEGE